MNAAAQRDVDHLLAEFRAGAQHPGLGTRSLGGGFLELRGKSGGRVIVKRASGGDFDVVGKFQGHARGDSANSAIINKLVSDYSAP
jgi:hypothetical protein